MLTALGAVLAVLAVALALVLAPTAGAASATTIVMEGRGWGHGIGMSQYGADGYALHGWKYGDIIKHYYTGVTLGKVPNVTIRVLLRSGVSSVAVTDAARFNATWGAKTVHLAAGTTATVTWSGGSYHLRDGTRSWSPSTPVTFVPGSSRLKLFTANDNGYVGHYRGRLRVVHLSGGLEIVNALPLESYLFGVVPRESPASWPIEALKAQSVAARSYAYRATGGSGSFDVYCTTASQMYGGADGEAASTDKAVTATKGIVPKYQGTAIVAYFFSTSGGHTENIENVWTSAAAVPYLKGVSDPYDTTSPYHAWPDDPIRRTPAQVASALGFSKGALRAVYVLKRGTSPRVVKALLIGATGATTTDGATLRARLGLRDTWVYFTSLSIAPYPAKTIVYGSNVTLTGRRYPQLAAGKAVTLHVRPAGGAWSSHKAVSAAGSGDVAGYTVRFTSYSVKLTPTTTTQYYFSTPAAMGASALSAHITIDVAPAVTLQASSTTVATGDKVTLSGTVTPATAAKTVTLQAKAPGSSSWSSVGSAALAADGTYSLAWTDAAAGATALRVRVAASKTLVAGTSPTVTITAS
ncbi:MAG: SpoIID/LytB domain-containing protein [Thermoleophilia bacterium]